MKLSELIRQTGMPFSVYGQNPVQWNTWQGTQQVYYVAENTKWRTLYQLADYRVSSAVSGGRVLVPR